MLIYIDLYVYDMLIWYPTQQSKGHYFLFEL